MHGDDGSMIFKYDLPIINMPLDLKREVLALEGEAAEPTQVQKLFEILDCDLDTAYESFMIKLHQEYNHEVDMYGDVRKAGESDLRVLDFGIPIPHQFISSDWAMKEVRRMARFNQDMPGGLELVHPNKFITNLRPVDDFRHTPIIPISEKDMWEHQRKIQERNSKGYYVEIKKDTIYFYTIALLSFSMILYTFTLVNEKNLRFRTDMERSLMLKRKANAGREGMNKIAERQSKDMSERVL